MAKLPLVIIVIISTWRLQAQDMQFGLAFGPAQVFYSQLISVGYNGAPDIKCENKFNFSGEFQYLHKFGERFFVRSGLQMVYAPFHYDFIGYPATPILYPETDENGNADVYFFTLPVMAAMEFPIKDNGLMVSIGVEKSFVSEEIFQDGTSDYYPGISLRAGAMYLYYISDHFQLSAEPWGRYYIATPEYFTGSLLAFGLQVGFRYHLEK